MWFYGRFSRVLTYFNIICVQNTAPKNTEYSKNETIWKTGHHAKAIAHAKSSICIGNRMGPSKIKD